MRAVNSIDWSTISWPTGDCSAPCNDLALEHFVAQGPCPTPPHRPSPVPPSQTEKTPQRVAGEVADLQFTAVSAQHYQTAAATVDGLLYMWGYNAAGQLGVGDTATRTAPVHVGLPGRVSAVACGMKFTVALVTANGTSLLYAWGTNTYGEALQGTTTGLFQTPQQVTLLSGPVSAISAGKRSAAAIINQQLYTWGYNANGQLGTGVTGTNSNGRAVHVSTVERVVAVAMGDSSAVVLGELRAQAHCPGAWGCGAARGAGRTLEGAPVLGPHSLCSGSTAGAG